MAPHSRAAHCLTGTAETGQRFDCFVVEPAKSILKKVPATIARVPEKWFGNPVGHVQDFTTAGSECRQRAM
jgi:hypothetical protein